MEPIQTTKNQPIRTEFFELRIKKMEKNFQLRMENPNLFPWKTAEDGGGNCDGGIEMSTGNVTDGVNHSHYY